MRIYGEAARLLADHLEHSGILEQVDSIRREHLEAFPPTE